MSLLQNSNAISAPADTDFYEHQIANSVRLYRGGANSGSKLTRTPSSTGTSRRIYTLSTWIKRGGSGELGQLMTAQESSTTNYVDELVLRPSGENEALAFYGKGGNAGGASLKTNASLRDHSAWYHIMVAVDTTQGTDTNRVKIYINGELQTLASTTYPAQNYDGGWGNNREMAIGWGTGANNGYPYDGLMAETIYIDGTAQAVTDLGESKNGVWIPKDPSGLTFGDNGFWLKYESSSDLGNDSSGNNNDFSVTNISAHDQMTDTPTFNSSSNGGNFPTYNPLLKPPSGLTLAEGNLKATLTSNNTGIMTNWQVPVTGKWYWEVDVDNIASGHGVYIGVMPANTDLTINQESNNLGLVYYSANGNSILKGTRSSYGDTWDTGDIISIAVDRDADTIQFYKNGSGQGTIDISSLDKEFFCYMGNTGGTGSCRTILNFGQDGTFAGEVTAGGNSDTNGYGNFKYSVPSGYSALCTGALTLPSEIDPASTDDNFPQKLFTALTYSGDGGGSQTTGFQPDLVWVKRRDGDQGHGLWDSTRGTTKVLNSDSNGAEGTSSGLTAFNSNGYTMGTYYNQSGNTYVSWSWRANGGSTSSGSGDLTSTHQVDPSGGFSIVKATGDGGSGDKTVTHGMSAAPDCILAKSLDTTSNWDTYWSDGLTSGYGLRLNTTDNQLSGRWGTVNSSIFTVKYNYTWLDSNDYIYYCFRNIEGYIKVGTYTGNADNDGVFVYTGFKPAWMLLREVAVDNWGIYDNKRIGQNNDSGSGNAVLYADEGYDEENQASRAIDILSNGFKLRTSNATFNASGTYVFLAMAHNPFKYALSR